MATNKNYFTYEDFLSTQVEIFEALGKKLNQLFIDSVSSKKLSTRDIVIGLLGILRETVSWYVRINKAMLHKNKTGDSGESLAN